MNFQAVAMDLFNYNYVVIPVNGKIPAVKWAEYQDKRVDESTLLTWGQTHSQCNIGVVCGHLSGILAIDLDIDDEALCNEIKAKLPPCLIRRKGKKGEMLIYKYNPEIPSANLYFQGVQVGETRTQGNQIVVPPSIHPETKHPYVWLTPYDLTHRDELTEIRLEHVRPFLEAPEGIVVAQGRNNTMVKIISSMITRGESVDFIIQEMLETDKVVNKDNPLFEDATEFKEPTPYLRAHRMYTNVHESVLRTLKKNNKDLNVLTPGLYVNKKPIESDYQPFFFDSEPDLPTPDGLLYDIINDILKKSKAPNLNLCYAAALCAVSMATANRWKFLDDTYGNLYICNVAPSGAGKDGPQKYLQLLLGEVGLMDNISGSVVTEHGFVERLSDVPEHIYIMDECQSLFRSIADQKDAMGTRLGDVINEIYSKCGYRYNGIYLSKVKEHRGACYSPVVCIYGNTTPSGFRQTITQDFLEKGAGSRFLFIRASVHPTVPSAPPMNVDATLLGKMQWITDHSIKRIDHGDSVPRYSMPYPDVLELEDDAKGYYEDVRQYFDNLRIKSANQVTISSLIWVRGFEHFNKIVFLHACGRMNYRSIKVTKKDLEFAKEFVIAILSDMDVFMSECLSPSGKAYRVLSIIREHPEGLSPVVLNQKLLLRFDMSSSYRLSVINDLITHRLITQNSEGNYIFLSRTN